MNVQLRAAGERGVLVDIGDLAAVHALQATVLRHVDEGEAPWDDVLDVVPAAETLLVTTATRPGLQALLPRLRDLVTAATFRQAMWRGHADPPAVPTVEIPVVYDGPDLADVAALTGLTPEDVVLAHTARPWRMAFGGFAPGFGYLDGGDPRLVVPRRSEPRTAVPAGAVGLAGQFSGVYPRESPGGWQLIGHTDLQMWDVDRQPPALVQPGWRVRFVAVGEGA